MIHSNDKQNQRKHRKMNRRKSGDQSFGGKGELNPRSAWAKKNG